MKKVLTYRVLFSWLLVLSLFAPMTFATIDPTGGNKPIGNYNAMGPVLKEGGSTARVTGTKTGTNLTIKDPYTNNNRQIFAGTFAGTLDGNPAEFYCIDFAHPLATYSTSNPHEYTDSLATPAEITYILNNYFPFVPVSSGASNEAAAVQIAIWHFADGMDANTASNATIKARALAIIADAVANAGNTTPTPTLSILPPLQNLNLGTTAQFQVQVVDLQNNPMNGVNVALTATSGTLSTPAVTTNVTGLAGPVSLVPASSNTSTITATATVVIPQGTRYVHKIAPGDYQKLVLATPVTATRNTTGIVNWHTPSTDCDLNGFTTFTQGGWGSPSNSGPGQIRDAYFNQVFPTGLTIGGNYTLTLTSAAAVKNFLPQGGTAGALNQNYTNPSSTSAGVFAGQVVALTLNVEYSTAGVLGNNSQTLGSLIITSGPLAGKTVAELLAYAKTALGGGTTPYTFSQLNDAATNVNENFVDGNTNNNFLSCGLKPIRPILECVVNNGDGTFTAHFGYLNENDFPVTIPVGNSNKFNRSNPDQGQPTVFNPGRTPYYPNADFQIVFDGNNLVWTLDGRTATASANSPLCVEHIYFDKKWLDVQGNLMQAPPATLPSNYQITVTSPLGTATGTYQGGNLVWNYQNQSAYGNNGLSVPVNGTYTVVEHNLPVGYSPVNGVGSFTAQVPGGYATNPYNGFDKYGLHVIENKQIPGAKLGDKVWLDLNMNGIQDFNENGVSGVLVKLYDCNDNYISSTTTDGNGNYLFDNLMPGDYYVQFILPANYAFSPKNAGSNAGLDSDADLLTGKTVCTNLTAGENDLTWDAGIYLATASLGDYVWLDENKNGIQDANENGIANITVKLYNCAGQLISTTVTNSDGYYLFDNLATGDYFVEFVLPPHHFFSPKDQGGNDATDSDADVTTGKTICTTLSPGENDLTWDAGMFINTDADLRLEKSVNKSDAKNGDIVTYTIIVSNDGPNDATGVVITDVLPTGMVFKNYSATMGTYDHATGLWTVGTIPAGGSASLSINAEVDVTTLNTTSIDLGPATGFNVFTLYDFSAPSSDTEGKMAVGRNFTAGNYSVGDKLAPSYGTVDVLIVGQNLTYTSGQVYNGNVVYGNSTNLPIYPVSISGGSLRKESGVIDFPAARTYLKNLSNTLGNYAVSGTTTYQWGGVFCEGNNPLLNVFEVDGTQLSNANNFEITVPNGAVVLVNIKGQNVSWHGGLVVHGTSITNVLYNFPQAKTLTLSGIDIRGSILAPKADVNFIAGVQNGQMIAKSVTGQGQFNLSNFIGNIPVAELITNIAEVTAVDQNDPDSQPGNGVSTEDDYDFASTLVTNYGSGSTGGGGGTGTGNWQFVGQFANGEMVWTLANDAQGNILAGTMGGKIFRGNGQTFTRINESMHVGFIWKLIVDASGKIYAGTEQGVFKSADNGATWTLVGLAMKDVRALVLESDGTLLAGTWGYGIFKSVNGGLSWTEVNQNLVSTAVHAMVKNANGDLFAGTFGNGVYKSDNHAASWNVTAMPYNFVWSLGVTSNGNLFAGTYGDGVYRSTDNGSSWMKMSNGIANGFIYAITVDAGDNIYVSTWAGGVYASSDMGVTWNALGMGGFGVSSLLINPQSNSLYVGTSNGALYMTNGITTDAKGETSLLPKEFELLQNYPNPFNPATTINYALPRNERVSLKVYDILGAEVATLIDEVQVAGKYSFAFDGSKLSSGVYFYRLQAGTFAQVKKMMLVK